MIYADVAKRQWVLPEVLHGSSSLAPLFSCVLGVSPPRLLLFLIPHVSLKARGGSLSSPPVPLFHFAKEQLAHLQQTQGTALAHVGRSLE